MIDHYFLLRVKLIWWIVQNMNSSYQFELSDDEIKKLIAILRFSKDACPIGSLPEKIEIYEVENLISKFEKAIA